MNIGFVLTNLLYSLRLKWKIFVKNKEIVSNSMLDNQKEKRNQAQRTRREFDSWSI